MMLCNVQDCISVFQIMSLIFSLPLRRISKGFVETEILREVYRKIFVYCGCKFSTA